MRLLAAGAILAFSSSSAGLANPMISSFPGDLPYIANPNAHMYEFGPTYSAQQVLAKLRRVCSSKDTADKRACSRGMVVLKRGYVELQTRRAAESAITD